METADIRRARLKEWFSNKTLPEKEKSYLSQLMGGKASFGEKAARRLERDYRMPLKYLDTPLDDGLPSPPADAETEKLRAAWDLLLPGQRAEMLAVITEKAAYAESIRQQVKAEEASKVKIVKVGGKVTFFGTEKRQQQQAFNHPDWRKK